MFIDNFIHENNINLILSWAVVVHAFNLSTCQGLVSEANISEFQAILVTEQVLGQNYTEKACHGQGSLLNSNNYSQCCTQGQLRLIQWYLKQKRLVEQDRHRPVQKKKNLNIGKCALSHLSQNTYKMNLRGWRVAHYEL